MAGALLLVVTLALARASAAAATGLMLEHSLDGGATYLPAGKLVGSPHEDVELTWERAVGSNDAASLQQLQQRDGFYLVRLNGQFVTSVRAACLGSGGPEQAQAQLQMDDNGNVAGFTYALQSCPAAAAAAGPPTLALKLPVAVVKAKPGPELQMQEVKGGMSENYYDPSAAAGTSQGARQQQQQQGKPGAAQKPDERTWLQKNWLFVVAGVLFVFNILGKMAGPSGGGR